MQTREQTGITFEPDTVPDRSIDLTKDTLARGDMVVVRVWGGGEMLVKFSHMDRTLHCYGLDGGGLRVSFPFRNVARAYRAQ